jgi:DNA polymerase III alpha subunit
VKVTDKKAANKVKLAAPTAADYVHLHNHTQYSLLDGLTKIPELVSFVKEQGMTAVGMTDHGTLSGTIEFYKECLGQEVKPLIGIETYVAARRHTDKDPQKDKNRYHLVLLAMNQTGYQNLMQLSTTANLNGFYYFPRIDHELLEQYGEGRVHLRSAAVDHRRPQDSPGGHDHGGQQFGHQGHRVLRRDAQGQGNLPGGVTL